MGEPENKDAEAGAVAARAIIEEPDESEHPQQQPHRPEIVELATLSLPASAMDTGLEAGEGTLLTFEASHETVEQMQEQALYTNNNTTQISAVVDLEVLSELVGVSEEEFITGLHHDLQEQQQQQREEQEEKDESEAAAAAGEGTPLISTIIEDESSSKEAATDQIQLDADPFLQTLADHLPMPAIDEDTELELASVAHTEAAATTLDDEVHFGHDAFLMDVPKIDHEGHLIEHHYVLALPEIHVEPSVQTETSQLSDSSWHLMERAMSILPTTTRLPTDIENVHLEATEHVPTKADPTEVHLDIVVERKVPVIGYIILFTGLFALASVGAALDLQTGGVSPTLKTLWRQISTSMALLPFVLKSLRTDGWPKQLTVSDLALLPVAAAAYAYMTLAFVLALEMTTLANAFVLSNMTSLVIIAGRAVLGLPVLFMEGTGAITGFLGAAICADDASRTIAMAAADEEGDEGNGTHDPKLAMLGNLVALSASFGTAAYLLIAKKLRPKMDLFIFMFCIMAVGSVCLILYAVTAGEHISYGMHPVHGIFGWMTLQPDRLPLELYMALVCNLLGTTGYIAVMKYFDPIVPATVMLLEPVVGALLGTAAGTAPLPGIQTWLGDLVVAGGTFLVIKAGARKTESIDATEALRPRLGASGDESKTVTKSPLISKNPMTRRNMAEGDDEASSAAKVIWEA